jgi:hypothetical protein
MSRIRWQHEERHEARTSLEMIRLLALGALLALGVPCRTEDLVLPVLALPPLGLALEPGQGLALAFALGLGQRRLRLGLDPLPEFLELGGPGVVEEAVRLAKARLVEVARESVEAGVAAFLWVRTVSETFLMQRAATRLTTFATSTTCRARPTAFLELITAGLMMYERRRAGERGGQRTHAWYPVHGSPCAPASPSSPRAAPRWRR